MLRSLCVSAFFALPLATAGVIDDFNRPDADTLGPNWTVQNGGAEIVSNKARALGASMAPNLVIYNGLNATSAFVDVYPGQDLAYIALVLAYADNQNNYFIKVQDQYDSDGFGNFARYAFYYGNNGGGHFAFLTSPFTSGRITAGYTGLNAFLDVDTNFDGIPDQHYEHTYAKATGGTGVGLGFYGPALADNFGIPGPGGPGEIPEPGSVALVLGGLGALLVKARRRRSRQL